MSDLGSLTAKCEEQAREIERLNASFDLRWKCDMRAIKQWQTAHPGNELIWPDHADLCVWLMEQLDAAQTITTAGSHPNTIAERRSAAIAEMKSELTDLMMETAESAAPLEELIEEARTHVITPQEHQAQLVSFARGNVGIHWAESAKPSATMQSMTRTTDEFLTESAKEPQP